MSFDWNVPTNHNNASTYQLSGLPFTTEVSVANSPVILPRVSRWVVLKAIGADATVSFKDGATGFTITAGQITPRLELRCTKIFFSGNNSKLQVIAGLTTCSKDTFINSDEFDYV